VTRRGVLEALKVLTTAHDQTLERARVDVYCAALDDLNDDALMAAARTLVRVSKWFPKPAEIREEVIVRQVGDDLPDGATAWAQVCEQIRATGRAETPEWGNDLTGAAVKAAGGWRTLCDSGRPDLDRRRFLDEYARLLAAERRARMAG